MVRFTVLASGSKGNSTVVSGGRTRILVDAGLSCRELFRRMKLAEEEPETLDAILVTHEHADHVNGISVTARKLGIPVYFTEATHKAWAHWVTPHPKMSYSLWMEQMRRKAADRQLDLDEEEEASSVALAEAPQTEEATSETPDPATEEDCGKQPSRKAAPAWLPGLELFRAGEVFSIGDVTVRSFSTPHDAADPVGFVFETEGVRIGYATDLGYVPPNVKAQLTNLDLLLLEANHDIEMLREGPYPWAVKQRVLSRVGHLSNDATAEFLREEYDGHAAHVILAHLSENNNLPDLARLAALQALEAHVGLSERQLIIADQYEPLSSLYF